MKHLTSLLILVFVFSGCKKEDPDREKALELSRKGTQEYRSGDINKAIDFFDDAIELQPDDAELYNKRARAKRKALDFNGAISDYEKVIKLSPGHYKAYYNLGIIQYNLGDKDNACRNLRTAREKGSIAAKDALEELCPNY